jgi:GrpB-like predicted nucleotidyltransferase (UPF0157 family)
MPGPVIIYPYNTGYPAIYLEERRLIAESVGPLLLSIEHFGSTSVPGLPGKDIVDILAGVSGRGAADECLRLLQPLGYVDVTPEDSDEWFYCLGKRLPGAYCHLHLVLEGGRFQREQIAFRNYLRTHSETAHEYAELKSRMAEEHRNDRAAYTDSKTAFIKSALRKAESGLH